MYITQDVLNVTYVFGHLNTDTERMIEVFNKKLEKASSSVCSLPTSPPYIRECTVTADANAIATAVTSSVRTTVEATASTSRANLTEPKDLKPFTIDPAASDFRAVPAMRVEVYTNGPVSSLESLYRPTWGGWSSMNFFRSHWNAQRSNTDDKTEEEIWIKVAPNPFAEGNLRIAYHGQLKTLDGWRPVVFKEFKRSGRAHNTLHEYLKQIEVSAIAGFLAKLWRRKKGTFFALPLSVLPSRVVRVDQSLPCPGGVSIDSTRYYCMEDVLPLEGFKKWSNNTGYWNDDEHHAPHVQQLAAFSAWTSDVTKGYLMVTDIQGSVITNGGDESKAHIVLTDPVILCDDVLRFGSTNMGPYFRKRCLDTARTHAKGDAV
jgi:hypothetical protein